ncbi:hypothetical protein MIR68_000869 [Amoeboaphelidium protococcarum]|nr:hypothetical protein MIR68_000869 [Amoeboaphelidium protococcarum]
MSTGKYKFKVGSVFYEPQSADDDSVENTGGGGSGKGSHDLNRPYNQSSVPNNNLRINSNSNNNNNNMLIDSKSDPNTTIYPSSSSAGSSPSKNSIFYEDFSAVPPSPQKHLNIETSSAQIYNDGSKFSNPGQQSSSGQSQFKTNSVHGQEPITPSRNSIFDEDFSAAVSPISTLSDFNYNNINNKTQYGDSQSSLKKLQASLQKASTFQTQLGSGSSGGGDLQDLVSHRLISDHDPYRSKLLESQLFISIMQQYISGGKENDDSDDDNGTSRSQEQTMRDTPIFSQDIPQLATKNTARNKQLEVLPTRKNMLGEGRYACVYKGMYSDGIQKSTDGDDISSSKYQVAVKVLHAKDSDATVNGLVEAFALQYIQQWVGAPQHNHIIRLHGVSRQRLPQTELSPSKSLRSSTTSLGTHQDTLSENWRLMLIMEYCAHGNVFEYIQKNPLRYGKLQWIEWCLQLAKAVEVLHTGAFGKSSVGVIHHDIKPHNVMLNDQMEIKLSDFGSAQFVSLQADHSHQQQQSASMELTDGIGKGTQAYTAPEILAGPQSKYTFSADIYSLGCTLYALLTGKEPFADIRNMAHQLWCIRKGFFESGANELTSTIQSLNNLKSPQSAHTPVGSASMSLPPPQSPLRSAGPLNDHQRSYLSKLGTYNSVPASSLSSGGSSSGSSGGGAGSEHVLFKFMNGEALYANSVPDAAVWSKMQMAIRRCVSLSPSQRPTATAVVEMLEEIKGMLLRFNEGGSESLNSPVYSGNNVTSVDQGTSIKQADNQAGGNSILKSTTGDVKDNASTSSGSTGSFTKVPGGRKPAVYL